MLEQFDPTSVKPAKGLVAARGLSEAALERLDAATNLRRYVDGLLAEGLAADALTVIVHALPTQYVVAWCCECVRNSLDGSGAKVEVDHAGVKLAEQCLRDPSDANRQLCLDYAQAGRYASPGAWVATAAAWAEGSLAPPGAPSVPAPRQAVGEAVIAALKMVAARGGAARQPRLKAYATRALSIFGGA